MENLKPRELLFWNSYLKTLTEESRPQNPIVQASFAGTRDIADSLLQLYLQGHKTAGSGLIEGYHAEDEDLPLPGNYWIILDSSEQPKCLVKTVRVEQNKFKDVPEGIAQAEGEGDLSLEYWRQAHIEFFSPFLKDWGVDSLEDSIVITEFFEVVYK